MSLNVATWLTAGAINGEYVKGTEPPAIDRFTATNAAEFGKNNFRRLKADNKDPA